MKGIKKIISILVLFFFVADLATFIIPAQPEADELPIIVLNENINTEECQYPVTNFPPKSEYGLSLIDPDPDPPMSFADLPSQFSWLDYDGDWTTSAKDQGNCGSCWAFGALGGLEAAINIAKRDPTFDRDLSEQYILACLSDAGSCSGGWMSEAIAAIKSQEPGSTGNGINGDPLESCMPYQGVDYIPCDDKCEDWNVYTVPPQVNDVLWQVKDFGVTTGSEDDVNFWNLLKTWCITYGPVVVDIYASNGWSSYWSSHHSSTDVYQNDDSGTTNHAQVLCGWVDDSSINGGGYWILKNSWGTGWGYNGFNNLAYGSNSLGTRDVTWVTAIDWPQGSGGGEGPVVDYEISVFSNYEYETYDGTQYPHPGDDIKFSDTSDGDVALREWDFNGDGTIDSTQKNPTHIYYNEGKYEVTLTVTSEWGLKSNRTKIIDVKEIWPPIVVLPSEVAVNALGPYKFDGRYSYDPDKGTITNYHWDFGDGSTDDGMVATHTFPRPDEIYDVTLTVTDSDNAKGSKTCQVKIDQTVPPVTEIIHGIGSDTSVWYKETQRISFSSTDWTSVLQTYYRIDNGSWKKYTLEDIIPIGSEGEHIVQCYSVDYWQNQETPVSETFYIDKTEPTLDVQITGGEQINGWYTAPVTIEFTGEDELSGLYKIMYSLDYGAWKDYKNPVTIGEGNHYVCAFAVDNAGNANEECIRQIKVDLDIPETTCFMYGQGTNNRYYKNVEIRVIGTDKGSGIKDTYYKLDNEGYKTYYQPITIDTLGEHTIEYYSVDNIGNQEQTKTTTFTISNVNFDLEITNPTNGLYLFGIRLLPIKKTILIGSGEIDAAITSFTQEPANIDHVDFLLDGDIQKTITEYPYIWSIDQKMTGTHIIEIIAYTDNSEIVSDQITATLLII